ncbi:MAG: fumarylacetoacetase, partial [Candidatus Eremiobacteraeota bacterium]|nr:fumarylacetoacetase [Candidatus Eremiobacteraeota bacterium]
MKMGVPAGSDFPIENLPYGVFLARGNEPHIGVAIGDDIFDLHAASLAGLFDSQVPERAMFVSPVLNPLLAAGRSTWTALRGRLMQLLDAANDEIERSGDPAHMFVKQRDATMVLPFSVGDYVDFYSSLEHATNMGKILRPGSEPLLPNWRYLPIGYHGRSSTVVIDGTAVVRPSGQSKPANADVPAFGPSKSLDIELEMGFVTGPPTEYGRPMPIRNARDHIFGMCIVNDWSARDIQGWEYAPLGPFLGKSFATSISPWVVTLDALEPYRVAGPKQEPQPFENLRTAENFSYDIQLEVLLQSRQMHEQRLAPTVVSKSNYKYMYWTMAQQLAHAASNGTNIRPGDLYA